MDAYAQVWSRAGIGLEAPGVAVELFLAGGLPAFSIVGLPAAAVRESRQRVRSALETAGFTVPRKHIIVSLAPADLPKEGGRFDLPIAIALLAAAGQFDARTMNEIGRTELFGELALSGELRPVRGLMPAARACADLGRRMLVPADNCGEAARVPEVEVFGAAHLTEVVAHLRGDQQLPRASVSAPPRVGSVLDLADVRGQSAARRALEVCAAGGHNLLMSGPPGVGKTMLAMRLPGLLPELSGHEAAEVAAVQSVSHAGFDACGWGQRPFRAPHHSASAAAMVGGGRHGRPGEISLAHNGVLFMDELPEFPRRVLEVLREPLETGVVHISRSEYKVRYPARFQLVAAMNPCQCGYLGDGSDRCQCAPGEIARYRRRISGPLLDRIDLHVEVAQPRFAALRQAPAGESTAIVRERVLAARTAQLSRSAELNSRLADASIERYCPLGAAQAAILEAASERLGLSARACARIVKVARTIADLDGADAIGEPHLLEAIGYRAMDRAL